MSRRLSCSIFDEKDSNFKSCLDQQSGLLGRLFYLEDRTDGSVMPETLYSKTGVPFNNSGKYERLIDIDGFHSPRMVCSSKFIELSRDSKYPIRLRYYQGPRTAIALTLLLRKVSNTSGLQAGSKDQACGSNVSSNYIDSDLKQRGWFIPAENSFSFPSPNQLAVLGSK